jgi:hypothetical protein
MSVTLCHKSVMLCHTLSHHKEGTWLTHESSLVWLSHHVCGSVLLGLLSEILPIQQYILPQRAPKDLLRASKNTSVDSSVGNNKQTLINGLIWQYFSAASSGATARIIPTRVLAVPGDELAYLLNSSPIHFVFFVTWLYFECEYNS